MSDKYIIKNCPCYDNGFCTARSIYVAGCSQCTDCKMKQIVEKCKNELQVQNDWWCGAKPLAQEILQLLDIQEVE